MYRMRQVSRKTKNTHSKTNRSSAAFDDLKFEDILKKKSLRMTAERKSLYEHLSGLDEPVGIKQLVSSLSGEMDQATVYRNIELFDEIGVINKIYTGWKYRIELSEKFRPHHHHMTCINCGKVIPINLGPRMEEAIGNFGRRHGFKIKNHEVELRGLCNSCPEKT